VQILAEHVGVAADGEEHVVEVMGDATREATYRLHPLRLQQLALERLAHGDVHHRGEDQPACGRLQRRQADLDGELWPSAWRPARSKPMPIGLVAGLAR
jgi:hypothetical protein